MSAAAGVNWWSETVNILSINNLYVHGFGFAAGDFDGDSHEDLLLLTQCGPTGYFLGNGDGTFRDASTRMTPLNSGIRVAFTYGDNDNDGDVDFYVSYFRHPNVLLQQKPDGSFVDVAPALGVALNGHYTGATFGGFNRDGWLDLVVAGGKLFTTDTLGPPIEGCPAYFEGLHASSMFNNMGTEASVLLQNGGPSAGFVFADVWVAAGIPRAKMCEKDMGFGDVVAADLDLDGALDLEVAEMFQNTKALRSDGQGHFTDMTAQWFPQVSRGPASASVSDFNNDGRPDVFFSDMHSDMWMLPPGILYSSIEPSTRYKGTAGASDGVGDNPTGPSSATRSSSVWAPTGSLRRPPRSGLRPSNPGAISPPTSTTTASTTSSCPRVCRHRSITSRTPSSRTRGAGSSDERRTLASIPRRREPSTRRSGSTDNP